MQDGMNTRLVDEAYYQMEADCGWGSSRPAFEGDFYAEPRDCTRNVPASFFSEELHPASFKACQFDCGLLDSSSSQMLDEKRLPRFDSFDNPPLIPEDSFFLLEVTAVDVPTEMPGVLGNLLLDFFLAQVVGSVSKVNKRKFCFKAHTLCWNAVCSLKVRIYRREQGVCVVEFQRRSGDSVSFNHVFGQAVRFLQGNDYAITADLPMEASMRAAPDLENGSQEAPGSEALKPILGMAAGSGPETQVECAEALALVAKDLIGAACLLRTDELPSTVKELLKAQRIEVALPTVGMLAALSDLPQGCPCLSDTELVQLIRGWAVSAELSVPVQKQLAQILEAAERLPQSAALWATENSAYNSTILAH